jgi:excinuclease UvrABC helicase subunit UvrB
MVAYQRQLEDLQREVGKKYEQNTREQIVQIYKEVDDAVSRYAKSHGIQAVFGYGDNPQVSALDISNIMRRIRGMDSTGCVAPIYMADGLDISAAIADGLNQSYPAASTGTAPTGVVPTSATKQ